MEEQQTQPQGEKIISVIGPKAKSLWTLLTKHFDKDEKFMKEEKLLLSSSQVSKIRIPFTTGKDLYNFRHGKIIKLELEDAFVTYELTRPNHKGEQ